MSHRERLSQNHRASGSLSEDDFVPVLVRRRRTSDSLGADQPPPAGRSQTPPPAGRSQAPPAGRSQAPPAGSFQAPQAGRSQAPQAGRSQAPPAGSFQAPQAGRSQAPAAGRSQAPAAGRSQAPQAGRSQAPPAGRSQAPPAGRSQAPAAGSFQAPQAGRSQAPPAGRSQDPQGRPQHTNRDVEPNGHVQEDFTLRSFLPSKWAVPKDDPCLRLKHPLRLKGRGGEAPHILVVTNKPIPMDILQRAAYEHRQERHEVHPEMRGLQTEPPPTNAVNVYYFEASIESGVTWIGLVPSDQLQNRSVTPSRFPGDCVGSIGMASDGRLFVSGNRREAITRMECDPGGRETLGCGLEISDHPRVFFTKNGEMLLPPMNVPDLDILHEWYFPAAGVAASGDIFANFGLSYPFRWKGSSQHVLFSPSDTVQVPSSQGNYPHNGGREESLISASPSMDSSTAAFQVAMNASLASKPSVNICSQSALGVMLPSKPLADNSNAGPRNTSQGSAASSRLSSGQMVTSLQDHRRATIYGRPSDKSIRLEVDFPGPSSPSPSGAFSAKGPPIIHSPLSLPNGASFLPSSTSSSSTSERKLEVHASLLTRDFPVDPSWPVANPIAIRPRVPASTNSSVSEETRPGAVWEQKSSMPMYKQAIEDADAWRNEIRRCCENANADESFLQGLLETCQLKQREVRQILEQGPLKFDDPTLEGTIHDLFTLNEILVDAIKTADDYLEGEKKPKAVDTFPLGIVSKRPPIHNGAGGSLEIDVLVQTRDIFSLICMLRAQGDKRLESALALMRFARVAERTHSVEAEQLRHEICSSGGMDSLLTLFRTKGGTRELKVVAALAVAYLLPSFEQSNSLQSSSLGLKIVECLRFLFASMPVTPKGEELTRDEMCTASARGVYTFWCIVLSPLLRSGLSEDIAAVRSFSESPELVRGVSTRLRRRSVSQQRVGGNVFDQRQEVLELQELLELTVSLIVEMAKKSDLADTSTGINTFVHAICAIDLARPIAVREGLLKVLVSWMRSQNEKKIRSAATSLNELTSTVDSYMAGWIHSQIVNEGALAELVNLCVSAEQSVRLAVAEILCRLCVAPHTRAAVVEAQCINCLISLLFEFGDPEAQKVAFAAGSALLQLVAGAMSRASVFSSDNNELNEAASPDKRDRVISDVVDGGAIDQFVAMARFSSRGKLRAMSIEALRVLSEDYHSSRRTRLQLCEDGAAGALGRVMKDNIEGGTAEALIRVMKNDHDHDGRLPPKKDEVVKELHQALCAWANILDYQSHTCGSTAFLRQSTTSLGGMNAEEILVKGCTQFVEAGGLESLLLISALPFKRLSSQLCTEDVDVLVSDLMVEACRSLASLSPLLLSSQAASQGYAAWSTLVLHALARILSSASDSDDADDSELANELKFDALRGIGALAKYKPLKMVIIDKYLPSLFQAKMARCDSFDVSGAADEVCLSLGFVEDELPQQIAGNDPKLMGDWFCMKRSLLIQSMARAEIRKILFAIWNEPLRDLLSTRLVGQPSGLGRSSSKESNGSVGLRSKESIGSGGEIRALEDIFEILSLDQEGSEVRNTITEQYHHVYEHEASIAGVEPLSKAMRDWKCSEPQSKSLLSSNVYPLDSTSIEKEWILSHRRFIQENVGDSLSIDVSSNMISDRVQTLMDCCIPSRLIQQDVMPIFNLQPESSFDFRGFLMPQRRYFSFRREGQLVSRLCDMNATFLDSGEVYWTLGFTNSTFAGEFSESLVQALYRCPLIKGVSFAKNANWRSIWSSETEDEGQDTSGLLANLAGSLPPWVSCIIYDNTLSDFALTSLVAILETMGRLSASQSQNVPSDLPVGDAKEAWLAAQKQGTFRSFAVRNSPHLSFIAWKGFFALLGKKPGRNPQSRFPPLASLRVLDLSGNELGDELCSFVLGRVLDRNSGCCLEQLDLSGNCIREGSLVVRVLRNYIKLYRFNQSAGVFVTKGSWKSPLISLNLSSNELNVEGGGLALEVIALLKNNALNLRSLDLSNNGLESEGCQFTEVLLSSLVKNACLHHLNISGNRFSARCIDGLLDGLNHSDSDSSLAFLQLENNLPPLTESQRKSLKSFVNISRTIMLQRYLHNRDRPKTEDVDSIDGESSGPFSFSDTASSIVDGTKRHPSLRQSSEGGKGENMITVLFSAPLVFHDDEDKLRPFAKLDFDLERELLWQCLKEACRDIELFFDTAHHDRLLTANTKRCSCLHYSGHGHHTHLPFENGKGGPHWLEVNEIRNLIKRDEGAPFKFVFVSACHSGLVGETFASAGVPHVVCCQQDSELKDAAALAFTRQFYLSLAVGHTVKESFEQGCKAVRATPNLRNAEEEMNKFILLPKDGNHNVPVFDARPVREWPRTTSGGSTRSLQRSNSRRGNRAGRGLIPSRSIYFGGARSSELSVRNMMQEDPSPTPPQFFTGREVDMYHVLNAVLTQKLVSVVGEKGVGRSSLVYGLCHYVNERRSTIILVQRIYFMKATQNRGSDRFVAMLRELVRKIMQDGRAPQQRDDNLDFESLIHAICKMLNNVKALLVIDRTEFLEGSAEAQDLVVFLSNLFRETRTRHVRVLLIGRHPLGIPSICGVVEKPYDLGPLSFCNTVRLFGNLCPHLHTPAERQRFYNRLITDGGQSDLLPYDPAASERTKKLFDALGNGIPSRTEKAAYTISSEDLSRLEQI